MKTSRFTSIQSKLYLIFTILFLAGLVCLVAFLKIAADAIAFYAPARSTYIQARQLYQARMHLQELEKSLILYELTADVEQLEPYNSSYSRLQENLSSAIQQTSDPAQVQALSELSVDIEALKQDFDLVIPAVEDEDSAAVILLHEAAYASMPAIFDQLDVQVAARSLELAQLRSQVSAFAGIANIFILCAAPFFLILAVIAGFIIARQLHAPLLLMSDELAHIQEDRFDPKALGGLPARRDELGYLGREYLHMAEAVHDHRIALEKDAAEFRSRIHE
jgi:CHASE3 domain sensor protein